MYRNLDLNLISRLMTPPQLLQQTDLPEARMIQSPEISSFEDLRVRRQDIRMLKLLPVKSDADRAAYHKLDQEKELATLKKKMGNSSIALDWNLFPYMLPSDVAQNILWVEDSVQNVEIVAFVAQILLETRIDPVNLIMFERPRNANTALVKGTFKHMRHIHFWTPY